MWASWDEVRETYGDLAEYNKKRKRSEQEEEEEEEEDGQASKKARVE
jgi:hypothetical protein